jgi:WD40 repeat protein
LFSTHGYSGNSVCLWDLSPKKNCEISSSTVKLATKLNMHSGRVLCSARAPGKDLFSTVSADETLRFWKFAPPKKEHKKEESPYLSPYTTLR